MLVIGNATNFKIKRELLLRGQSWTESRSTERTETMVQQPETKDGKIYSTPEPGHSNSVKCGQTMRMGNPLPRFACWGKVEQGREPTSYKCFRVENSKTGDRIFPKSEESQINSSPNQQYRSPNIFSKTGGKEKRWVEQNSERDLRFFACKWYHNYGRISPKCSEYSNGLGVMSLKRFEQVETVPSIIPELCKITSQPNVDLLLLGCATSSKPTCPEGWIPSERQWKLISKAWNTCSFMNSHHLP